MQSITVHELTERGALPLIDVREPHEFTAGHVPGAVNIPMSVFGERLADLPDGPINVICELGARSASIVQALEQRGYDATNVEGGTSEWIAAGYPVER